MKTKSILFILCSFLFLSDCITKYEATGIEEMIDILVVEGIITDDETIITLSHSVNLTDENLGYYYIDSAHVYVECDNGTRWKAEPYGGDWWISMPPRNGRYLIKTGKLNPELQYRLKIEIEELTKTYEYCSDYSYPIETPEIDSIFWVKRGRGQPVMMYVATRSYEHKIMYYSWSYREDWEVNAAIRRVENYPYNCWNSSRNKDLLLGTTETVVHGQLMDILTEINPSDRRLSSLYRIIVNQNAIRKRTYDYYLNIKKNAENMGSLFAPVPSELLGNIICVSDPKRPAIGYVDISTTSKVQRFITQADNLFENPLSCNIFTLEYLIDKYGNAKQIPITYIDLGGDNYTEQICVDCTFLGGILQKPDDWPNNYY